MRPAFPLRLTCALLALLPSLTHAQPPPSRTLASDVDPPAVLAAWSETRPPPGRPQTVALVAMEREVDAFLTRGRGFQASVNGLVARQHARQQAALRQGFQRQIDAERRAEAAARAEAIRVFERFLRTHPEDRARTPDVMFRLAELYYDAATQARLDADEAHDRARAERQARGLPAEDLAPTAPDHRCALHLYRHLLARFDDHRLRDATHYLLGWTLREMGREEEAASALLGLVCPAQHTYAPRAEAADATPPAMCAGLLAALPALPARAAAAPPATTERAPPEGPPPNGMTVPIPTTYARCEPLRGADGGPSRYAAEAWYYLGEHHFDRAHDDGGNALAIAAYQEALRLDDPDGRASSESASRFWTLALYKIGWARFRMQNGYPEALRQFSRLLDHYDRLGPAAAAQGLRADALRWIGVILSEGDWGTVPGDEGQRCQRLVESLAHPPADAVRPFDCAGLLRVSATQGGLIPQDRRWTPDAYLELADGYFQQTKYFEAVAVYELFLQRTPLHVRAPAAAERIAVAFERQRRFDQGADARRRLARYAEGGEWHDANRGHPGAQREAAEMARNALRDNAIRLHQEAASLRARAVGQRVTDPARAAETLREADARYAQAAGAYVAFLRAHPHDDDAYEARYNRADALFWSRAYRDAARAYAEVVASNESDRLLAPAAYMAVRASESHVRALARRIEIPACDALRAGVPEAELVDDAGASLLSPTARAACSDADSPLALTEAVRELQDARMDYVARVPARLDDVASLSEVVPEGAPPGNAPPFGPKFSYLHARTLLRYGHTHEAEARYERIVQGHCGDPVVGRAALDDLRAIYTRRRDLGALERLTRTPSLRGCEALQAAGMDLAFQRGARAFAYAMEASAAESAARFEQAARVLESALAAHPTHRDAPLAWIYLGRAHDRSGRSAAAARAYLRVVEAFDHDRDPEGRALGAAESQQRVNLLDEASLRAAQSLERLFDFEAALRHYRAVLDDPRRAGAEDHAARRHDALAAVAFLSTHLERWDDAVAAWQAFLPTSTDARERAEASLRLASLPLRARRWEDALTSLRAYLQRTPVTPATAAGRVQARHGVATALQRLGRVEARRQALREVAEEFRASGEAPGSPAAGLAAEALFEDLDASVAALHATPLVRGDAASLGRQVASMRERLRAIDAAATTLVGLRGGAASIGALTRQAEAHEHLAAQEQQVPALVELTPAQRQQLARAEAQVASLRRSAERLTPAQPQLASQLQQRADVLQARVEEARARSLDEVRRRFDDEAAAERSLAVINYGLAVHTARRHELPTPWAARALERLRAEDNREAAAAAFARRDLPFPYREGMFAAESPGALAMEPAPVATPGLASP